VKLGTGVIATMAALILGLLVSSSSSSLERVSDQLLQIAGKVVLLDRALANYGPETNEIRTTIKQIYASELTELFSASDAEHVKLTSLGALTRAESIPTKLHALVATSEAQRQVQAPSSAFGWRGFVRTLAAALPTTKHYPSSPSCRSGALARGHLRLLWPVRAS